MSGAYGQPGYNPQYQNPYPAGGAPPPGWNAQGGQQQGNFHNWILQVALIIGYFYFLYFPIIVAG